MAEFISYSLAILGSGLYKVLIFFHSSFLDKISNISVAFYSFCRLYEKNFLISWSSPSLDWKDIRLWNYLIFNPSSETALTFSQLNLNVGPNHYANYGFLIASMQIKSTSFIIGSFFNPTYLFKATNILSQEVFFYLRANSKHY
jgi:hypothetical protein